MKRYAVFFSQLLSGFKTYGGLVILVLVILYDINRERNVYGYFLMICFSISQNKLTACLSHYKEHGVTPREKEWGGRKFNTKAFKPEDIQNTMRFIQNFAEDHALVLPGRVPGFKRSDVKILPSAYTKAAIWDHYRRLMQARGMKICVF